MNFLSLVDKEPNKPMFILDGLEVSAERVYDLNQALIGSVTILKDSTATSLYGEKGKNGVIVIRLKNLIKEEKKP